MLSFNDLVLFIKLYFMNIVDKFLYHVSESFNNPKADQIVAEELKELESACTENVGELTFDSPELINHTFDNTSIVDGLRAKGF